MGGHLEGGKVGLLLMDSENPFQDLPPIIDEIPLGKELLQETCQRLKLAFEDHLMDAADDRVVVGYWTEDNIPIVFGVFKEEEFALFRVEARCFPLPEKRHLSFFRALLNHAHFSEASLSAPGDGWVYACQNKPLLELGPEEMVLAIESVERSAQDVQKEIGKSHGLSPPQPDDLD
ncbi:hypothetical protein H8D30_06240 [bacterium]|nr:hypothetical protein [bacterium]